MIVCSDPERGGSSMTRIKPMFRNRMEFTLLDALVRISQEGPQRYKESKSDRTRLCSYRRDFVERVLARVRRVFIKLRNKKNG